jgi:hypothetical protein
MIDAAEEEKENTDDKQDNNAKNNSRKISTTGKYQYFAKTGLVLGVTHFTL